MFSLVNRFRKFKPIFASLQAIRAQLPATPSKFHYIFNLKDLSRIFAGMLVIHSHIFTNIKQLIRVWRNEFTRVIGDRLTCEEVRFLLFDLGISIFFRLISFTIIEKHIGFAFRQH